MARDSALSTIRRKWWGRGTAVLAGAVGLTAGQQVGRAAGVLDSGQSGVPVSAGSPLRAGTRELRLFGRNWHIAGTSPPQTWARPGQTDQFVTFGELMDGPGPGASKVGEFYATCSCVNAPFGDGPLAARYVEFHTLNLEAGTLTGMGTSVVDESVFAVVGGTGAYAGARGSYVARQLPVERGGDGTAEFVVTLDLTV